jgi:hypothetical protein
MWKSMNLKSLLIGGILAVLVMCAMGDWPTIPTTVVPSEMNGRFTITVATGPDGIVQPYVLDTATGEVWTPDRPGVGGEFYLPKLLPAEPNDVVPIYR